MTLNDNQLLEIENYITFCGIVWYEVKMELVDHFANIIEEKHDEKATIDITEEAVKIHQIFGYRGFKKLQEEKQKSVQKMYRIRSWKTFKSFFTLPKILGTIAGFYVLQYSMHWFSDKEDFFFFLYLALFSLWMLVLYKFYNEKKKITSKFLTLDRKGAAQNIISLLYQVFFLSVIIRSEISFLSDTYNSIHLCFFEILFLVYISVELVYQEEKNYCLQNYPNAFL